MEMYILSNKLFASMTSSRKRRVPELYGYVKPGFEEVQDVFKQNLENDIEQAGSFAAYYRGELVVNLWAGLADEEALRPWKEDTLGFFFSTTKSASAIVIAHLVDRGLINYEDKVAQHWPEFAQNGKGEITLKILLSNQAGLAELDREYRLSWIRDDPVKLSKLLAYQKPLWKPGTKHGYHPMTIGLYLDQIVQRVDKKHRTLSQYFKEEIAEPFNIDFHIGLPKLDQHRVARLVISTEKTRKYYTSMLDNFRGDKDILMHIMRNPRDWRRSMVLHDPHFMELPNGSSHGVGTAEAMAKLHGILANGTDNKRRRILSQRMIELLQTPLSWGLDVSYGLEDIYSLGMRLLPVVEDDQMSYMFGCGGFGGQYGAADTKYKVGWAYVTNHLDLGSNLHGQTKWSGLCDVLYHCIHKLEKIKVTRTVYNSFSELNINLNSKL